MGTTVGAEALLPCEHEPSAERSDECLGPSLHGISPTIDELMAISNGDIYCDSW